MNLARAALAISLAAPLGCDSTKANDASAPSSTSSASASAVASQSAIPAGSTIPSRPVTASVPGAQRAFDEGLLWTWSFNHDEAVRCYTRAIELDPTCAMAWWGIALCRGPHINNPFMTEESSREAWAALTRAKAAAASATPVEAALIEALSHRYADPASGTPLPLDPVARAPYDRAYADAMAKVHARWPGDDDIATLYAEALMDTRPWDFWTHEGAAQPETPTITSTLELVLARNPNHAGANHYYIHAIEASPHPERADASAERLRTLVPVSGHMVHMPTHIDVRMGRWNQAADQNIAAAKIHAIYAQRSPKQGFYRVYMLHNQHFHAYACMMAGRSKESIAAARTMLAEIPDSFYRDFSAIADAYASIEIEALMRFGRWDELLALTEPRSELPITRTMWRYGRGVALAAKGDVAGAKREEALAKEARSAVAPGAMMAINPAEDVLTIAALLLDGEILYRQGEIDGAVSSLNQAVAIEDRLKYMEPPDWVQPVRHTLGAILLEKGRFEEAAVVYREDLKRWPENGWSLYALAQCSRKLGREAEATELENRFAKAWNRADIQPGSSCLCVTGGS